MRQTGNLIAWGAAGLVAALAALNWATWTAAAPLDNSERLTADLAKAYPGSADRAANAARAS